MRYFLVIFLILFSIPGFCGNAQWFQVTSPNFTVITDAGEKNGREVAMHFEQMRAVFGTLFAKAKISSSQPLYIIAFKNTKDFRNVCPLWQGKPVELAGYFQQGNGVTYISVDLSTENKWNVVFHEYGHFLLNSNVSQTPPWFDEGFAEYYSTVKIDGKDFHFGSIPEAAPYILQQNRWLPIEQLFSTEHDSPYYNERNRSTVFYAEAWLAMAHYWFDGSQRPKLMKYMTLRDQSVPVAEAIKQAFGIEPKALDKELHDFYSSGRLAVYRSAMPPGLNTLEFKSVALDTIDARARVAELKVQMRDRAAEGAQEFDAILKEKPDHPVALRGRAYAALQKGDRQTAISLFRRAAATQSTDPHVYYFSAVLLSELDAEHNPELLQEMQANLARAIQLDPNFADAYGWLGLSYAWQGKMAEAISPTQKAIELAPRDEQWAMNLAGFYAGSQRFDDAIALCNRLTKSSNLAIAQNANSMLISLSSYKAQLAENARWQEERNQQKVEVDGDPNESSAQPPSTESAPPTLHREVAHTSNDDVLSYFQGKLLKVICSGNRGTFMIVTVGNALTLTAPNRFDVSFGGKRPFACELHDVDVKGFYSKKKDGNELVALEIY